MPEASASYFLTLLMGGKAVPTGLAIRSAATSRTLQPRAHLCRARGDQAALTFGIDAFNWVASRDRRDVLATYAVVAR